MGFLCFSVKGPAALPPIAGVLAEAGDSVKRFYDFRGVLETSATDWGPVPLAIRADQEIRRWRISAKFSRAAAAQKL